MLHIYNLSVPISSKFTLKIDKIEAKSGRILAVLGQNGSGKSTLLKTIAGDLPDHGCIHVQGRALKKWQRHERANTLAFLPQNNAIDFAFTAQEIVQLGTLPLTLDTKAQAALVIDYMQMFDCAQYATKNYLHLSGGQQQRVQWARTLIQLHQAPSAPVLLLDEPTSAQDLQQQHKTYAALKSWVSARQAICIMSLHDLNHATRYCDDALILCEGKQVAVGETLHILTASCIKEYWGYNTQVFEREGLRFFL